MADQRTDYIIKLRELIIGYQSEERQNGFSYGPVDLDIRSADLIAVIGRNGIGKSSLLRTITLLQPPLKGKIILYGRDVIKYSRQELSRLVSFVSTEIIGLQNIRVFEVVSLGRFPYTNWLGKLNDDDHEKIETAIEKAGIRHIQHKFLYQLSDGERQKTMIARALAQDTPVIILDDPTAFLDLPSRHDILRLMNTLAADNGKTILFSTHDLDIARHEADKLWLMTDNGIIEGAPEDLLFNQLFHKLFLNSSVEYDYQSDGFRLKKELSKKIRLTGEKKFVFHTQKALERIGYQGTETDSGNIGVEVISESGIPLWILKSDKSEHYFDTIYDLMTYIKNHYK